MVLLLTPNDVKGLVTMKEAAEAMEQGFLDWARTVRIFVNWSPKSRMLPTRAARTCMSTSISVSPKSSM